MYFFELYFLLINKPLSNLQKLKVHIWFIIFFFCTFLLLITSDEAVHFINHYHKKKKKKKTKKKMAQNVQQTIYFPFNVPCVLHKLSEKFRWNGPYRSGNGRKAMRRGTCKSQMNIWTWKWNILCGKYDEANV